MNCRESSRSATSFLSGLGIGAILMYLFDPEEGQSRRKVLGENASETFGTIRDKAGEYSHAASAGASALGLTLKEQADSMGKSFRKSRFSDSASKAGKNISSFSGDVIDRFGSMFSGRPQKSSGSFLGKTALAIGCVGLGMGAMYLFDPNVGRRRRAYIRNQFNSTFNRVSTKAQRTGQDVVNRTMGFAHEARNRMHFGTELVDDRTLVERIRSQIGRYVSNPHDVRILAHDGRVTVSGNVMSAEVDNLLKCIWSVRGVKELVNQLNISHTSSVVSDLPGEQGI